MTSPKDTVGTAGTGRGTIVGLFRSQADAERAIRDLKDTGIDEGRIGVAMRDRDGHLELPEDATGGILGGVVGLLAGVGALTIPGVGPIIAGGALASAFARAEAGTAARGLFGTLVTMGISEDDARYFETGLRQHYVLVTVTAGSRAPEARDVLRASGADVGRSGREVARDPDLFESHHEIAAQEETWRGSERRDHHDSSYGGPERRYSHR
jgi:hypothetical protein